MWEIPEDLRSLYNIVEDYLTVCGFERIVYNSEAPDYKYLHSSYKYNGDLKHEIGNFTGIGLCISRICHNNGAKRDTSYRVEVCEWNGSTIHTLEKIKVTIKDSEKLVKKRIDTIIELYNNIKKEREDK